MNVATAIKRFLFYIEIIAICALNRADRAQFRRGGPALSLSRAKQEDAEMDGHQRQLGFKYLTQSASKASRMRRD